MSYIIYLRLTYLKGFFWGDKFLPYGRRWGGKNTRVGWGAFQQRLARRLADGRVSAARTLRRPYPFGVMQNMGLALLGFNLAPLPKTRPWAWALVHHLQVRSYKSSRYKLGLPANGQRTHTNATTTGRVIDEGAKFIRKRDLVERVWESRKPAKFISKKRRGAPKGTKAKGAVKAAKPLRTKKKVDVWK